MEKLKFVLFSIISLCLLGFLGYWAVSTLKSGTEYQADQELKDLREENGDLKIEIAGLKEDIRTLQSQIKEETVNEEEGSSPETPAPAPSKTYKYQSLINELQKLADGNILMKLGSSGTRVGTIQKFLNAYNDTSNRIDNDYGAGTEKAVKDFQADQGLKADGQAGKGTFVKMIDWLKKQG